MAPKRKGKEIETSGSGASRKQAAVRNMGYNSRIKSKGIGINLLSLDLSLLVDTLILMLWID